MQSMDGIHNRAHAWQESYANMPISQVPESAHNGHLSHRIEAEELSTAVLSPTDPTSVADDLSIQSLHHALAELASGQTLIMTPRSVEESFAHLGILGERMGQMRQ